MTEVKYPGAAIVMPHPSSPNANSVAIIAAVSRELRGAGASWDEVRTFRNEATAGSYDELQATVRRWVEVL